MSTFRFTAVVLTLSLLSLPAHGQLQFDDDPINYASAEVNDPIMQLHKAIATGEKSLKFDPEHGYLPALLEALDIDRSSQALVFSQTSFQLRKISPRRPRALYFNDHTYVGWVQGGDIVEITSVDDQQGPIFYSLAQEEVKRPQIVRDRGQCMTCHASSRTQGVPGLLVRSVYSDAGGRPWFGSGTFTTDHGSPFKERWGGWYVTGDHGKMRHMGNVLSTNRDNPEQIDREAGANVHDLSKIVNVEPYLEPTSDIVSLMVLEHQSQMQNYITLANFETRSALHYDQIMNKALGRDPEYQSESTQRRIVAAAKKLIDYLLFTEEFVLAAPVSGNPKFQNQFTARGPQDKKGRSLRDFDLTKRLFKYPCSYLIYSPAFEKLPAEVKAEIMPALYNRLVGPEPEASLTNEQRQAIHEILIDTVSDYAAIANNISNISLSETTATP